MSGMFSECDSPICLFQTCRVADLKKNGPSVSYGTYHKVCVYKEITFGPPPQDECDQSQAFKSHEIEISEVHDG